MSSLLLTTQYPRLIFRLQFEFVIDLFPVMLLPFVLVVVVLGIRTPVVDEVEKDAEDPRCLSGRARYNFTPSPYRVDRKAYVRGVTGYSPPPRSARTVFQRENR
jgi:hypothetical protein